MYEKCASEGLDHKEQILCIYIVFIIVANYQTVWVCIRLQGRFCATKKTVWIHRSCLCLQAIGFWETLNGGIGPIIVDWDFDE